MKNTMEYKEYIGSVEFSEEDCILYGKVMGIRSLISYEGEGKDTPQTEGRLETQIRNHNAEQG